MFAVGDRVRSRFGGGAVAFPGAIAATHGDGTYHVVYDDGDEEQAVGAAYLVPGVPVDAAHYAAQARADFACAVALQPAWEDAGKNCARAWASAASW